MLDSKGYTGKVSLICQQKQAFHVDEDKSDHLNAIHKMCGGTILYESIITEPHPWILSVYIPNLKPGHTGVESLSSLQQNIQI